MTSRRHLVACMSVSEMARIMVQLEGLQQRAKELNAADLCHLLEVAELAAKDWVLNRFVSMEVDAQC